MMGLFGGGWDYQFPKQMRGMGQGLFDQYGSLLQNAFGPDALRRNTSLFTEDFDNTLRGQGAQWGNTMGARGFAGGPNLGMLRSGGIAGFRANERGRLQQGMLSGLGDQFGMLQGLMALNQRQRKGGLLGGLGSALGQYYGMGGF